MKSPKDMWAIQIEITNACVFSCSNCTRFCGHHKQPFFMDWDTFVRAVDSLKGYDKIVGIIGGEPTIHPQFERFIDYLSEQYMPRLKPNTLKLPMEPSEFTEKIRINQHEHFDRITADGNMKRLGLWSSLPNNYYKYYEKIQKIFGQQMLNDHQNDSIHQPLLVSRKDLCIPDEQWIPLRDNCWVQNQWSASITPKGAFFCEVAAALDVLFDGPGGWPIETDWWKREPDEFKDQLHWCEICGGALFDKGRLASEGIDDVSKTLMEKLKKINSPKVKQNQVALIESKADVKDIKPMNAGKYLENENNRFSNDNHVLCPRGIVAFVPGIALNEAKQIAFNHADLFKGIISDQAFSLSSDISSVLVDEVPFERNFGVFFNKALAKGRVKDWVYFSEPGNPVDFKTVQLLKKMILNPGCLYWWNDFQGGKHYLFAVFSQALKTHGFDGLAACRSFDSFISLWNKEYMINLDGFLNARQGENHG